MKGKTVAVAVVVMLLALASWAEWTLEVVPFKRRDVAIPALSATPQKVVAAYIDALDAHDCKTARNLWLRDTVAPQMWCDAVRSAQIVSEMAAVHESGRIDVPLMLNIRWRPFKDDGTIQGNPFGWTYILAKDSRGAWRIVDEGQP